MGNRKYILTDETRKVEDRILHRIKAVKDFNGVHEGDLGVGLSLKITYRN